MTDQDAALAAALQQLARVLERIEQKLDATLPETGSKQEAARILGISSRTLERRLSNLQKGVHFWQEGGKLVFDLELIRDWQRNHGNSSAHQRAIEVRRQQLLSQQKKGRKGRDYSQSSGN